MVGMEKKERTMTDIEKKTVSYHEAGHCLISYLLKQASSPVKTSIIPRGEAALGFSQPEPEDKKLYNRDELFARLCVLYAGRGAEEIVFDCITTGASDDIDKATKLVYSMVNVYGMTSEIGLINTTVSESQFRGIISDNTKITIDKLVHQIVTNAYKITKKLIVTHREELETIAQFLLDKEVLTKFDMEDLFKEKNIKNSIDITNLMNFPI
jgi:AFG3 family protein